MSEQQTDAKATPLANPSEQEQKENDAVNDVKKVGQPEKQGDETKPKAKEGNDKQQQKQQGEKNKQQKQQQQGEKGQKEKQQKQQKGGKEQQQQKGQQQQQKGQQKGQGEKQKQTAGKAQPTHTTKKQETPKTSEFVGCFSELPSVSDKKCNTDLWQHIDIPQPIFFTGIRIKSGKLHDSTVCIREVLEALRVSIETLPDTISVDMAFAKRINDFLEETIPVLPIGVTNVMSFFKNNINKLLRIHESKRRLELINKINTYLNERIHAPVETIIPETAASLFEDDDVILTYSVSSLLEKVFIRAKKEKDFKVVLVKPHPSPDPQREKDFVRALVDEGIVYAE